MILPVTAYQCVCDNCSEVIEIDGEILSPSQDVLIYRIEGARFAAIIDNKHICIMCIAHDEDGNQIIDTKRTLNI